MDGVVFDGSRQSQRGRGNLAVFSPAGLGLGLTVRYSAVGVGVNSALTLICRACVPHSRTCPVKTLAASPGERPMN